MVYDQCLSEFINTWNWNMWKSLKCRLWSFIPWCRIPRNYWLCVLGRSFPHDYFYWGISIRCVRSCEFFRWRIREVNLLFGGSFYLRFKVVVLCIHAVPLNIMKNMVLQDPSAMKMFAYRNFVCSKTHVVLFEFWNEKIKISLMVKMFGTSSWNQNFKIIEKDMCIVVMDILL